MQHRNLYESIQQNQETPRFPLEEKLCFLQTECNRMAIMDASLGGFKVRSDLLFGRGTSLKVEIVSEIDDSLGPIKRLKLNRIEVEVRWSEWESNLFIHGLKINGLNDEQKELILTQLTTITRILSLSV